MFFPMATFRGLRKKGETKGEIYQKKNERKLRNRKKKEAIK